MDVLDLNDIVRARFDTLDPGLDVTIYDGKVPDDAAGGLYVAYYPSAGVALNARHVQVPGRMVWAFFAICVADDPGRCVGLADKVRALFAGWRPDPEGATTPLNEVDLGNEVLPDDTVPGHTRYSFTLRYTLTTTRSLT